MATKKKEEGATTGATQTAAPSTNGKSNPDLDRELLRSMLLQRRFEERCAEAYALGKIGGFCHLYIGQEAVSTGSLSVLRPDDYIITLGQYLRPSSSHIKLDRYVTPEEFRMFREEGMAMGFRHVESGPLVRSSYHAWEQVQAAGV